MTGAASQKPRGLIACFVLMAALNLVQVAIADTSRELWFFALATVFLLGVAVVAYVRPDIFTKK